MRIVKPKALKRGDVIGVAAPASPPASEEQLAKGIRYLERLGYRVELGAHIYHRRGYLAGSDEQRAADLHQLFANPKVKAIFTVRGGYGSMRILPLLNFPLIRRNPKILLGYSDITALHLALFTRANLVTFSGPMVTVEMANGMHGNTEEHMWRCLTSTKPLGKLPIPVRKLKSYGKNTSTGRSMGGNLSLIAALIGSRYFPRQEKLMWLLEEVDERPYRIDRMLAQLERANLFAAAKGVMLGTFVDCEPAPGKPSLSLKQVFRDIFQHYRFPVVGHLSLGHIKNPMTIPLGVRVRMSSKPGSVEFLESGVG